MIAKKLAILDNAIFENKKISKPPEVFFLN